jgi:phenylacetate-coenzyme A ligase PaaK-like adenylate-forming protein
MLPRFRLQANVRHVTPETFEQIALQVFRYQAVHNPIYAQFLGYLNINSTQIDALTQIPFMPIGFFKQHMVLTGTAVPKAIFESSGTTGSRTSRHHVADLDWYEAISIRTFEQSYGSLRNCHVVALLPSYLERNNSSLVYMVQQFINETGSPFSGFFLQNTDELLNRLKVIADTAYTGPVVLWGVTFALLDLVESGRDLSFLKKIANLIVMETGGMKGRRHEMLREEVHKLLTKALPVTRIHSEYGMTELLSQAYSDGDGVFTESPTLRILLRDINDPFAIYDAPHCPFRYGGINVIDLANIDSCAFVETQDLGRFGTQPHTFEVIGRFDNSDVRGCNLMI